MGQTLTHGIYLPDEGERNCYNGLAANWSILDGAVGTIAEHTSALSGKAPLVHTHTKSDITDFPVYGTTAGTICEGNDSRLSDARTPVAHTHTKSDVTDLLNSNFIPSANISYDLGSSSYQWNNLYAKNYYYNGTAWGLDRANVWSSDQIIQNASIGLKNTSIAKGSNTQVGGSGISLFDKDNKKITVISTRVTKASRTVIELHVENTYKNGILSTDSDAKLIGSSWYFGHLWNGTPYYTLTGLCETDICPIDNNKNLGSSNYKWKTLNGINPGALSIFNPSATQDPIDVPNTWITDGSAWNTLNVSNMGDGWVCLTYRLCGTNDYILARFGGTYANAYPSMIFPAKVLQDSGCYIYLLMPVTKAMGNIYLEINLDSNAVLVKHSFIPAYGTV
jgi:hypothetical protein